MSSKLQWCLALTGLVLAVSCKPRNDNTALLKAEGDQTGAPPCRDMIAQIKNMSPREALDTQMWLGSVSYSITDGEVAQAAKLTLQEMVRADTLEAYKGSMTDASAAATSSADELMLVISNRDQQMVNARTATAGDVANGAALLQVATTKYGEAGATAAAASAMITLGALSYVDSQSCDSACRTIGKDAIGQAIGTLKQDPDVAAQVYFAARSAAQGSGDPDLGGLANLIVGDASARVIEAAEPGLIMEDLLRALDKQDKGAVQAAEQKLKQEAGQVYQKMLQKLNVTSLAASALPRETVTTAFAEIAQANRLIARPAVASNFTAQISTAVEAAVSRANSVPGSR